MVGCGGWMQVVIEADAFKMSDPVFNQLNQDEDGANDVSRVVHEHSTTAANRELLAALRNQRDVVMDGTMTWAPPPHTHTCMYNLEFPAPSLCMLAAQL